uniref:WD repeat-containing protein 25-like n=1 Tax=Styela clava TaxID=7725 RepID=UPI001939E574|nr:WD repeat-containing protein 25-like [Styela clava]
MDDTIIKPYISKRKRKSAQKRETDVVKGVREQPNSEDIKKIFLTDDVVYQNTLRNPHGNRCSKFLSQCKVITDGPLWKIKWCKKFSHLLSTTSHNSIRLYDVMKGSEMRCVFDSSLSGDARSYKDLDWSRSSRQIVACSFDKTIETWDFLCSGNQSLCISLPEIPSVVRWSNEDDNLLLVGGANSFLASYDIRSGRKAISYKSQFGNLLSIDSFSDTGTFVATGDVVSRQSAQYSIIVWDFATGAKLSDQIFQERYSCPAVSVHPSETSFLAQTNGNYIARFNATSPYRLDKYLRYDQHTVEGYPVGFDISPDGTIVVSGSSDGSVVFYKYTSGAVLKRIMLQDNISFRNLGTSSSGTSVQKSPIVSVQFHPVLQSMVAVSDWTGKLHLLK